MVVDKATVGGIGNGEVEERVICTAMFGQRECQAIFGEIPVGTVGEHGEDIVQEVRLEVQRRKLN